MDQSHRPSWPRWPRYRRYLGLALLAVVLAGTFVAYLQPGFMFDVANRIMLCF